MILILNVFKSHLHLIIYLKLRRFQSTLVIAEHSEQTLAPITSNIVTAAQKIGGDITVLVAGKNCAAVSL